MDKFNFHGLHALQKKMLHGIVKLVSSRSASAGDQARAYSRLVQANT